VRVRVAPGLAANPLVRGGRESGRGGMPSLCCMLCDEEC